MDPISDMLTRIRNGYSAKKAEVLVPYSKFKHNLAKVMQDEGWINSLEVKQEASSMKNILIQLKYKDGEAAISGIKRVSKPGQRIYSKNSEIPRSLGGIGTTIVSTSQGLMTDRIARKQKVGGEVVCQIW
ncbi:MAG TPA: 30S ribosomal protein S8 [Patescibacteria group bacterium]|jgi:small subunit ribosomal protein S8|nr:30S ribosomal protein S8 [Patescibacteria group bacterium]